jgi:hypothetical protein
MPRIKIKPTEAQMNNFLRDLQEVLDKHDAVMSMNYPKPNEDGFSFGQIFTVKFNIGVEDGNRLPSYTEEVDIGWRSTISSKYRIFDGV